MRKREKILKELNYLIVLGDKEAPYLRPYGDNQNSDYDINSAVIQSKKERVH
jgi:hypothetical protein